MVDLPHVLGDWLAEHLAPVAIHDVQKVRKRRSEVAFVESKNVFQLWNILIQQKYAVEKNVGRWRDTTKQRKSKKQKSSKSMQKLAQLQLTSDPLAAEFLCYQES